MFRLALTLLVLTQSIQFISGAYCHGSPDAGERTNDYDIIDTELTLVKSIKNAMVFEAGPANARFPVVHVWGTPYEMGYAQGTIRRKEIIDFVSKTWAYLVSEGVQAMDGDRLPQWLKEMILSKGMKRALGWSARTTAAFTPQSYFDELRGLADATGIDYDMLNE
jgi:isopenicillin-N N-acyltransferase-like protein